MAVTRSRAAGGSAQREQSVLCRAHQWFQLDKRGIPLSAAARGPDRMRKGVTSGLVQV
jgi:hypothetical protein